ncbi:MAG: hypothetical protein KY468_21275, partial [Armatimonadetes bacterium]|nr:hypothetical protein [Armatimonadota bacterium]
KPLILADPSLLRRNDLNAAQNIPAPLSAGRTLGQTFRADRPFITVSGKLPTWNTKGASVRLTLYQDGPEGKRIKTHRVNDVTDNAWVFLNLDAPLPPGTYYLELSEPEGILGWWSHTDDSYPHGQAYADGKPAPGDRTLSVRYADEDTGKILNFFTFRKPNPDYFRGPSGPNEWAWMEVYPQHVYYSTPGVPEQMTVSVAQNAVEGKLGVLSNPRAHGRSFHDDRQPPPSGQDYTGRNFAEQAERAQEVDPDFVFITGWNEWIAMRFPREAPFAGTGPVNFVDQFNHEYSRDIEPVKGGHADSYYYQMAAFIRRFKGVRKPEPAGPSRTIRIDGDFRDWRGVRPEYRDDRGDTARRSHRGWGREGRYRNETGRNDFILLKAARDEEFLYFYAQTREPITPPEANGWMMLLLNTDGDSATGWEGYDFIVNRTGVTDGEGTLERNRGGWNWEPVAKVQVRTKGREMELALPRKPLSLRDPLRLDFKWIDSPGLSGDILAAYTDGDSAPNGRFRYRYLTEDAMKESGSSP